VKKTSRRLELHGGQTRFSGKLRETARNGNSESLKPGVFPVCQVGNWDFAFANLFLRKQVGISLLPARNRECHTTVQEQHNQTGDKGNERNITL